MLQWKVGRFAPSGAWLVAACVGALGCDPIPPRPPAEAARYHDIAQQAAWDPDALAQTALPPPMMGDPGATMEPAGGSGASTGETPSPAGGAAGDGTMAAGSGAAGSGATGGGAAGSGEVGGAGSGATMAPDMPTAPKPTGVTLDFVTLTQGGRYAPRNIGAVWVANASGQWVKAMEVWALRRAQHLTKWLTADPTGSRVDAISQATLAWHVPHHCTWNLKDALGTEAPDGDYTIFIEVTEREDAPGEWTSVTFTKGPMPQTVMVPDSPYFTGLKLVYQ